MAFLSPLDKDNPKGEYWELNHAKSPSAAQKNAVSPITYLEYMGKKIVFTGDVVGEPAERVMEITRRAFTIICSPTAMADIIP